MYFSFWWTTFFFFLLFALSFVPFSLSLSLALHTSNVYNWNNKQSVWSFNFRVKMIFFPTFLFRLIRLSRLPLPPPSSSSPSRRQAKIFHIITNPQKKAATALPERTRGEWENEATATATLSLAFYTILFCARSLLRGFEMMIMMNMTQLEDNEEKKAVCFYCIEIRIWLDGRVSFSLFFCIFVDNYWGYFVVLVLVFWWNMKENC